MDRATGFEPVGRGFDSLRARQFPPFSVFSRTNPRWARASRSTFLEFIQERAQVSGLIVTTLADFMRHRVNLAALDAERAEWTARQIVEL